MTNLIAYSTAADNALNRRADSWWVGAPGFRGVAFTFRFKGAKRVFGFKVVNARAPGYATFVHNSFCTCLNEAVFSAVADFAIDVTFDNLFWREVTRGSFPEDGSDDSQTIILNGVFRSKQARLRVLSYHGEGPALASIHAFNPRTYDALKANLQIGFQWYFHPIMK